MTIGFFLRSLIAITLATIASVSIAQADYPSRPIKLVVGFTPGSGSDLVARLIAQPLSDRLGQPVIVENRSGAGGLTATTGVTRAAPDGYTILLATTAHGATAAMRKSLPFDPVNDFTWISTITAYPFTFVVKPDSPIKSLKDFIELSKAEPGRRFYTSPGVGSAVHLVGEWIMSAGGAQAVHVPFQGVMPQVTELLAGRTDLMIDTLVSSADRIKNGQVRVLATSAPKGSTILEGVPTVADTYPGIEFEAWLGIAAPKGVPAPIAERLTAEISAVLDSPDVRQKLENWKSPPKSEGPAEFKKRVETNIQRFSAVVKERKIDLQ